MHAEKALDNTPGIFLIKVFTKQGIARKIPILIKDTSQKHIANTILNDKTLEAFSLNSRMRQRFSL